MERTFKPAGYSSLSPYLIVEDAGRLIKLMEAVFEAKLLRRFDFPNGDPMHVELKIDDTVLMITTATETWPSAPVMLHVYVPDAQACFQKALGAGCESLREPVVEEGDTDLRGMFKDFAGNTWAISTQQKNS
ncbi:MAG: VOC family protein [Bacteroidota bacterium]